jgi:predicted RecA/RadA family phage recombinase
MTGPDAPLKLHSTPRGFIMALQATFVSGEPTMVDHTPSGAVAAGDVIVTGDTPRIAHVPIAANALGSLAVEGGIYKVKANAAIAADKKVYWDDSANEVTETSSSNKVFGVTVEASTASDQYINVRHDPSA